jgi:hypothetical protein
MKKWLIFAVIAAMVLTAFPSCGGDDAGGEPVADNVKVELQDNGNYILITWTGDSNADYVVFAEVLTYPVSTTPPAGNIVLLGPGQRLLKYMKDVNGTPTFDSTGVTNDSEESWSYAPIATSNPPAGAVSGDRVRFGVGYVNAGGYTLEQVTIKWDTQTLEENSVLIKDVGFFELP